MGNKVTVTIYGKEYTVAGDKPREDIIKLAAHVQNKSKISADTGGCQRTEPR
jgi:Cell division protein ZapA.